MTKHVQEETVSRYIDGLMNEQELQAFEEKMSGNAALKDQVERIRTALKAVNYYGLKEEVAAVHRQFAEPERPIARIFSIKNIIRYGMAAAACFILVFLGVEGYRFSQLHSEKLYQENFVPFHLPAYRSSEPAVEEMETAYSEERYDAVVELYKKASSLTNKQYLLAGTAYLELDDPFSAIPPLKKLTSYNSSFSEDGEYYLSLAYLRNRDYDRALEMMQKIHEDPDHIYRSRITEAFIRKVRLLKWK